MKSDDWSVTITIKGISYNHVRLQALEALKKIVGSRTPSDMECDVALPADDCGCDGVYTKIECSGLDIFTAGDQDESK